MAWFKIDDGWWSHPKTLALSNDAIALWVRAGSWSCQHLTDGEIPNYAIKAVGGFARTASELVKVGYWDAVDDSWVFHDWADYQEHSDVVKKRRSDARERMRAVRTNNKRTTAIGSQEVRTTPTRPDPTRPTKENKALVQPAVELTREFEMFWEVFPRKQAKAPAVKAFKTARKKVEMKVLMRGVQAYALLNIGQDKSLIKLAAGWLNDERWADEQIINATRQTVVNSDRFCEIHPDYPVSARYPCEACSRSVGLSDGREF